MEHVFVNNPHLLFVGQINREKSKLVLGVCIIFHSTCKYSLKFQIDAKIFGITIIYPQKNRPIIDKYTHTHRYTQIQIKVPISNCI